MGWAPLTMLSMSGLPSASRNGPGRGVGHGYADAAGFTLVDVVAGEEKVILAVGMDGRGRPHGAFHPLHLVVGDDRGCFCQCTRSFDEKASMKVCSS